MNSLLDNVPHVTLDPSAEQNDEVKEDDIEFNTKGSDEMDFSSDEEDSEE